MQNHTNKEPSAQSMVESDLTKQAEEARRVLVRLQWLVIILLAGGLIWLYFSFQSVVEKVDEKIAKIDTVDTRLNAIDDHIFALNSNTVVKKTTNEEVPYTDDLIKVELALADNAFKKGDYRGALTILQTAQWQLKRLGGMATTVKSALSNCIDQDIAYLNALKNQPDAWEAHVIKMLDVQAFLQKQQNTSTKATLDRVDIALHDATMMLSLAIGAGGIRDRDLMTAYLQETKSQLEAYITLQGKEINIEALKTKSKSSVQDNTDKTTNTKESLVTVDDALYAVYELLANAPKDQELQSVQMLNSK